jgi:hypothetical protein
MYSQIPPEVVTNAIQVVSYVFTAAAALLSVVFLHR